MKKLAIRNLGASAPSALFSATLSISDGFRLSPTYAIPTSMPLLAFSYGQGRGRFGAHCIGVIKLLR